MLEYKTKSLAYQAIEEEEDLYVSEHFCPLLKDHCNRDCVCFNRLSVHNKGASTKPWKVDNVLGCANKMFFGR